MKQAPAGWPRISVSLFYDDAARAIDWLCRAYGFEVRLKVEGEAGRIEHSELTFGEGLIMVGNSGGRSSRERPLPCKSPRSLRSSMRESDTAPFVLSVQRLTDVAQRLKAVLAPATKISSVTASCACRSMPHFSGVTLRVRLPTALRPTSEKRSLG